DVVEAPDAVLAYEQRDGIFESMRTRYTLEPVEEGARVTATTEFTLGGVVGTVLDSTLVMRKRRQELNAQFDYLEEQAAGD
ncbi:MAG: SRPBCC family protein, partial [Halobacteriales archaeon]